MSADADWIDDCFNDSFDDGFDDAFDDVLEILGSQAHEEPDQTDPKNKEPTDPESTSYEEKVSRPAKKSSIVLKDPFTRRNAFAKTKDLDHNAAMDYKKVAANRAELSLTYSGIQPKNNMVDNVVKKSSKGSSKNNKEKIEKMKMQAKIRKDLEAEVLSKQIQSPITLAAKRFAAATGCNPNESKLTQTNPGSNSAIDILKHFKSANPVSCAPKPGLARGFKPGELIDLLKPTSLTAINAKKRAAMVWKGTHIENYKSNKKTQCLSQILKKVETNIITDETASLKRKVDSADADAKRKKLEAIEAIINRKSSHDHEIEDEEKKAENKYFNVLEKKEKLDEKLAAKTQQELKVVTCKICSYTAPSPSDLCKIKGHKLSFHMAIKRFFKCKACSNRLFIFDSIWPVGVCDKCGSTQYEKTSMYKLKDTPKLFNEKLLIRGEEHGKFLNSSN